MKIKVFFAAAGISSVVLLSGCSFSGAMEKVVDVVTDSDEADGAAAQAQTDETFAAMVIDESVGAPEIAVDLGGKTSVVKDSPVALQVVATSPDGGLISYQWYRNNVSSNGGGTAVPGAVGDTYAPDTSERGIWYYYAVAVNTVSGKANMSTSAVEEVSVWDNMYWQQNADTGGYQYICRDDGKYPADTTMMIDGTLYTFNSEGFVIDGEERLIDIMSGQQIISQPDSQEANAGEGTEESPAEEAPAEEAPAEEAPAEETPAEETPEESGE